MNIWEINGTEITTVKDFSEYAGVTRQTIYTWIYQGLPVVENKHGKGAQYLVLFGEALKWIKQNKSK